MCQRNITRRSIPASQSVVKKQVAESGMANGTNTTADVYDFLNGTFLDCFQLGGAEIKNQVPYVSAVWMGLAIPFGIIIGAILALLTFRFCCKKYWQEEYNQYMATESTEEVPKWKKFLHKVFPFLFSSPSPRSSNVSLSKVGNSKLRTEKSTQFGYKPLQSEENSLPAEHGTVEEASRQAEDLDHGMADALVQTSSEKIQSELLRQDVETLDEMEQNLTANRNAISEALTEVHLNQISEGTKADQAIIAKLMEKLHADLGTKEKDLEIQYQQQLEAIRKNPDPDAREQEINRLNAETRQKRHNIFKSCLENFQVALKGETKLNEAQLTGFMAQLSKSLAELEEILNENLDARAQVLLERGAYRSYLVDQLKATDDDLNLKLQNQKHSMKKSLRNLAADHRISEQCTNQVMKEYGEALQKLKKSHKKDIKKQMEETVLRLQKYRSEEYKKLKKKHRDQMRSLMEKAGHSADVEEILTAARDMLNKQSDEIADYWSGVDKDESSKLKNVHLKLESSFQEDLNRAMDASLANLKSVSQLTQTELKSLKREHELEVTELEKMSEMERKVRQTEMREQLEQNKKEMGKNFKRSNAELQKVAERQEDILQKVLDTQLEIGESDRQKIMAEHDRNRNLLNSLLKLESMKQEKLLEAKLCERKSSLALERNSATASRLSLRHSTSEEQESKNRSPEEAEIEKEKALLEEEKEILLQKLREKIAEESRILLDKQDESMAEIIGHLQVGQARRQAFLNRQNKLYQRLEHVRQLELELQEEAKRIQEVDNHKLENLMTEYKLNLEQLNEKLQDSRHKQLEHLKEKLETKKKDQQNALESKFTNTERDALLDAKRKQNSFAGTQMLSNRVRRRKQRALEKVDSQGNIQLQKQREKLNRELQDDLDKCLLEQKQSFLSQIATLVNLTPSEIQNIIRTANYDRKMKKEGPGSESPVQPSVNSLDPEQVSSSPSVETTPTNNNQNLLTPERSPSLETGPQPVSHSDSGRSTRRRRYRQKKRQAIFQKEQFVQISDE